MHIMKVLCRTLFDCTFTGVTGHLRPQQLPFTTKTGLTIDTPEQWNRSRNQQRNWESLLQIISLRTQPMNVVPPIKHKDGWHFEFEVEAEGVLSSDFAADDLAGLGGRLRRCAHGHRLGRSRSCYCYIACARRQIKTFGSAAVNTSLEPHNG
jgi:hypothetical protein